MFNIKTDPELVRLLELSTKKTMTPEEVQTQRESWVRGMCDPCEHGVVDYEQCPDCRDKSDGR